MPPITIIEPNDAPAAEAAAPASPAPGKITITEPGDDSVQNAASLRKVLSFLPGGGAIAPDIAYGALADLPLGLAQAFAHGKQMFNQAITDRMGQPPSPTDAALSTQSDQNAAAARDWYQKNMHPENQPGADVGVGIGNTLPMLPAGVPIRLAQSAPATARFLAAIGNGTIFGGASAGASPVFSKDGGTVTDYGAQKADQVEHGAATGAVAGGVLHSLGSALSPVLDRGRQMLADAGISLTPGQRAGGWLQSLEDKQTSTPVLGAAVESAKDAGVQSFNRALYRNALQPLMDLSPQAAAHGEQILAGAQPGRDGVAAVGNALSDTYDAVLPHVSVNVQDPAFQRQMTQLNQLVQTLPADRAAQFRSLINYYVDARATPAGLMNGETLKEAESQLGRVARGYLGAADPDQRALGEAIAQAQANLRGLVGSQNPQYAPVIQATNAGWATLVQIERAAGYLGAPGGVFTPAQFASAVKATDNRVRSRGYARGEALNQDLADAAKDVLSPGKDSGTAGRLASSITDPTKWPGFAVGAAASVPYLLAQKFGPLLGDIAKRFAPYAGAMISGSQTAEQGDTK